MELCSNATSFQPMKPPWQASLMSVERRHLRRAKPEKKRSIEKDLIKAKLTSLRRTVYPPQSFSLVPQWPVVKERCLLSWSVTFQPSVKSWRSSRLGRKTLLFSKNLRLLVQKSERLVPMPPLSPSTFSSSDTSSMASSSVILICSVARIRMRTLLRASESGLAISWLALL